MPLLTLGNHEFTIAPTIGTCIMLQDRGIDLLGISGESELQKLVANPVDFLKTLETLIASQAEKCDDPEQYAFPAIGNFMAGGKWIESRVVVLESFQSFFQDNGYPQLSQALAKFEGAAQQVTERVSQSLASGALGQAIDKAVEETIEDLTAVN